MVLIKLFIILLYLRTALRRSFDLESTGLRTWIDKMSGYEYNKAIN